MYQKKEFPRKQLPEPVLDGHPEWVELYWRALELGWRNIMHPSNGKWLPYMACMPKAKAIWQWDSCFMLMYGRFLNGLFPATNNLDNLYGMQEDDGYIRMAYDENPASGYEGYKGKINPPLYAWAEWENYGVTGDRQRLSLVLPRLVRYFDWVKKNRRYKNEFYWFEGPGSTGMDNAPRASAFSGNCNTICHIDLNAQQALSALYIARMARVLNQPKICSRFVEEHDRIKQSVNRIMWNEATGFYYDTFNDWYPDYVHLHWLNHKTIAGFWPLLAGITDGMRINRLIEHLFNPKEFLRPHLIPTLSADDLNYDPMGSYWLGSVWAPTNYMVVKGLEYADRFDVAQAVARNHIAAMHTVWKEVEPHTIWECYSSEYDRPATGPRSFMGDPVGGDFVGWSALGPVAMLIEHILGIQPNVPEKSIVWRLTLDERHGLRRLRFGEGTVDLMCMERKNVAKPVEIKVRSDCAFKLCVEMGRRNYPFDVVPGTKTFRI